MASSQDQYEVVRPIGSGSFGQVFLVLHNSEQRHYVMKEIAALSSMDDKQRESTELEVNLLSGISHPNIVGYRDSYVNDQGHLAIFMEYCEHGDMDTYLQEAKKAARMPGEPKVLEWFVQIVFALHELHRRKILHRDLKTQNIFLTGSMSEHTFALKLGDFGIAKVLNSTTDLAKTQIGTPFYMSPELFNNKPYGYKSDVWGLGCVLYEAINCHRPFDAQSVNGLAFKVLQGRYTPITASCTEETKWLLKSMLSTNPSHRPTLQEILHTPAIRRKIAPALQTVIAAGSPEAAAQAEQTLTGQLNSLGLGRLVNSSEGSTAPRRDRRQLLQRLERAERRRKREEDTLRRLQETAALLAQCLNDASPPLQGSSSHWSMLAARPHELDMDDEIELVNEQSPAPHMGISSHVAPIWGRGEAPAEAEDPPAMSHRDRVLLRKERRREEEQQRFEEEARKIREENLAYQRAWVQDSQRFRASSKEPFQQLSATSSQLQHQMLPQLPLGSNTSHLSSLSPLLGCEHIHTTNLAHPFQNCHPQVVNSPRRPRASAEPKPPRPQFGQEPPPPHEAPPHASTRWSHFSRSDVGHQTSRSMHSVCLEALGSDGFERLPEPSEDSGQEGSANHSDDGSSDAGWGSDEQVRRQSLVLQQRIDACKAAIYRHKMTIETLQYVAQEGQEGPDFHAAPSPAPLVGGAPSLHGASAVSWHGSHASHGPDTLTGQHFSGPPHETRRGRVPPFVQDRIARLKRRCLEGLGNELFEATRQCLQTLLDAGEVAEAVRPEMIQKLGLERIGFYSLIDQIVYMECRWGMQDLT